MRKRTACTAGFLASLSLGTAHAASPGSIQVLASRDSNVDTQGQSERVRLLRTNNRYLLIREVEKTWYDPAARVSRVTSRVEMVGDQVTVRLRPGATSQEASALSQRLGGKIIERIPNTDVYLIELDRKDIDAIPDAIVNFQKGTKRDRFGYYEQ